MWGVLPCLVFPPGAIDVKIVCVSLRVDNQLQTSATCRYWETSWFCGVIRGASMKGTEGMVSRENDEILDGSRFDRNRNIGTHWL